jgi:lipopolysaccharide transport system ATP-binding protein
MSDIAIKVEKLSKKYIIGHGQSGSLRETLGNAFHNTFGGKRTDEEEFWALHDVSFEIKQGEAVGIIGRNGAGKSTLLKLLSKITYPTIGKITMNGRVSSLLEVGTGFHPELTGRENIYLNGTILGMSRREVKSKFDEIVAFSGVEKFLDMPVKRYSSGMYVRLAFAVAAHLEPEILIIDEVLAVGDAEFQKKCLGKMDEVAQGGRTVLFVSHNMQAIKTLCQNGMILNQGRKQFHGKINNCIELYYGKQNYTFQKYLNLSSFEREYGLGNIRFESIELNKETFLPEDDIEIKVKLNTKFKEENFKNIIISIHVVSVEFDVRVYHLSNNFLSKEIDYRDENIYRFVIKKNALLHGKYKLELWLGSNNEIQDFISQGIYINIEPGNIYNYPTYSGIRGLVQNNFEFEMIS